MNHSHGPDGGLLLLAVLLAAIGYETMATVGRRPWPRSRTALFLTGCLVLAVQY